MLHRNLLAMDAEELLRGHPVDGAVLMGGCDKATPALLLALVLSTCDSGQTLRMASPRQSRRKASAPPTREEGAPYTSPGSASPTAHNAKA